MGEALATVWDEKKEAIRKIYGRDLSPQEFEIFVGMGRSMGANPFNREIWAYKIGGKTNIFLSRDFARKKAQDQPDYNGHGAEAVYSNDGFAVDGGVPKHTFNFKDRGKLIGAYGIAWRKGIEKPYFVFVKFDEYNLKQALWVTKPETMIKKVAEHQVLRMAWQDVFKGTYGDAEQWVATNSDNGGEPTPEIPETVPEEDQIQDLASKVGGKVETTKSDITQKQAEAVHKIIQSHFFDKDKRILPYREISKIYELNRDGFDRLFEFVKAKANKYREIEDIYKASDGDERKIMVDEWSPITIPKGGNLADWTGLVEEKLHDLDKQIEEG